MCIIKKIFELRGAIMVSETATKKVVLTADDSDIEIREITDRSGLKKFVEFQNLLYKGCEAYVPALNFDELDTLDPKKNPAYEYCDAVFYMAYIDGKPVGRICGLLNREYNRVWERKCVRFTRFDYIDDIRVSGKLISAVENWALSKGMDEIQGPMGFNDFDKEGMLVEGFDEPNMFFTIYNHEYYVEHMEKLGYEKSADWIEYKITAPESLDPRIYSIAERALKNNNLRSIRFKKTRQVTPYKQKIFDLLYEGYKHLYGYIPLSQAQIDMVFDQFVTMVRPEFLSLIVDENDEAVCFGVIVPSMSEAARKSGGNLFPFGFVHLLKALTAKKCDTLEFLLIAVKPELQSRGVNAQLLVEMFEGAKKFGVKYCETGPMLESNNKIHLMWKRFEHRQHHRRRCYIRKLDK